MSVKLADTLAPLGSFEVAKAEDISVEIGSDTKMLQDAIDEGLIGGGDSSWTGTHAEWEALLPTEKAKYTTVMFTDDVGESLIDDTTSATDKVYSSNKIATDYPFKLGIDADGNYGYYKVGADSVTPFNQRATLLWENPNPTTAVQPETYINLSADKQYTHYIIKCRLSSSDSTEAYEVIPFGSPGGVTRIVNNAWWTRIIEPIRSTTRIQFYQCAELRSTNTNYSILIPIQVYGIDLKLFDN